MNKKHVIPESLIMNKTTGKVLVVDDVPNNLDLLLMVLNTAGIETAVAPSGKLALSSIKRIKPDLVLLDIMMPEMDGYEVCQKIKAIDECKDIPIIFISAQGENDDKLKGFELGGVDYITKPFVSAEVLARVKAHIGLRHAQMDLKRQKNRLEQEIGQRKVAESKLNDVQESMSGLLAKKLRHPEAFQHAVYRGERIHELFCYIEALASSPEPILLIGESGVGKEVFSKAIHNVCGKDQPLVSVNIAGFDDALFSDTLFGHTKGAFTGADTDRPGMVEKANGGILFLDEIGDLTLPSQVKLLRLVQEGEYYPVGSDVPKKAAIRIVAATNVDLKKKIAAGAFREDLYYRLAAHHVNIPPLRERKEDIGILLDHFIEEAAVGMGKRTPSYPQELVTLLKTYTFPGNIRELRAMVYDAISKHEKGMLSMRPFKEALKIAPGNVDTPKQGEDKPELPVVFGPNLPSIKQCTEMLVDEALSRTDGNQSLAADILGITRGALNQRLKKREKE